MTLVALLAFLGVIGKGCGSHFSTKYSTSLAHTHFAKYKKISTASTCEYSNKLVHMVTACSTKETMSDAMV